MVPILGLREQEKGGFLGRRLGWAAQKGCGHGGTECQFRARPRGQKGLQHTIQAVATRLSSSASFPLWTVLLNLLTSSRGEMERWEINRVGVAGMAPSSASPRRLERALLHTSGCASAARQRLLKAARLGLALSPAAGTAQTFPKRLPAGSSNARKAARQRPPGQALLLLPTAPPGRSVPAGFLAVLATQSCSSESNSSL